MKSPIPTLDSHFPTQWLEVAEGICERYYAEFPDHDERYGARGRAYCAHDNAYLVAWLIDALSKVEGASFSTNVAWLRSLLKSRNFPMSAFDRNLELVQEAVTRLRPDDADEIATLIAAAGPTQ